MVVNKNRIIAIFGTILIAVGLYSYYRFQYLPRHNALQKADQLSSESQTLKAEMLKAYQERFERLKKWNTQAFTQELPISLNDQAAFDQFDVLQNQLNSLISSELTRQKLEEVNEFRKIEEKINRTRKAYHEKAFEILKLTREFRLSVASPPVFQAENLVHSQLPH